MASLWSPACRHTIRAPSSRPRRARVPELAPFDRGTLGVYWASGGTSPWERHPDNDELLVILEGHADVEILTNAGPVVTPVRTACLIVVPRGLWHRHRLHGRVKELYLTPRPERALDGRRSTRIGGLT